MDERMVLWDVDHTLIDSLGLGGAAYHRIFPEVTGRPVQQRAVLDGRTDLGTIDHMLRSHDIEPTEDLVSAMATALAGVFEEVRAELAERGRVLPGAAEALAAFDADPLLHQSVLTGNTADVARIKLGAFDLLDRFDLGIGAFGDDHLRRGGLVPIARERARLKLGIDFAPDRVVLIGDTLNDVRAAHESGARLVAVATGSYSAEELRSAGAEVVFEALPPPKVLRQALG
ncbi:HAD hydrolase-like protein [Saccharopolyspora dendranthemae]|uniref:Phosphoglycolate phosphatase-like HAD superfamily hydrolase n=1 Tax=Saccharopolyspora dendranthemae TaxID=1181886 RepID=A0A561U797_9PSEU|nr:HAD hydrolase-like protein [Saccharopolyspora dendranthemae]TWF95240.1 phosphoglycolate phosphatase-like HAD superfamily hydrolase [Saccharopolyspora dendranthemae]